MKYIVGFIVVLMVLFSGCADVSEIERCVNDNPYGFWSGLLHGWIVMFSFIGSLFSDDIAIYAVNNTGGWYDFGFCLGIGGLSFGSSKASK